MTRGGRALKCIFLTGGTGFLGAHVLKALHAENYSVVATTRCDVLALPGHLVDRRIQWISNEDAASAIEEIRPYAVVHLATDYGNVSPLHETLHANEVWPLSLLEAGIRAGTEIFLNTDSFFGKLDFAYSHMRPYTLSKSNFLAWGRYVAKDNKTRFITLRLEHVFGENDRPNKFVPSLLHQLKEGKIVNATVGTQRRDFIYAGDVANAFLKILSNHAMLSPKEDEIEVGSGSSVSLRSFIELAKGLSKSSSPLVFGNIPMRQDEIMNSFADTTILSSLGWKPQLSLESALQRCIASL